MAENSGISWTDHTFNPWIGCTRISPACDGCYAAGLMGTASRFGPPRAIWGGPGKGEGTRTRTADSTWAKVRSWNRKAAAAPGETFVFCASLADVFDNAVNDGWRADLFRLIWDTPNLTWLLLTKRPAMIQRLFMFAQKAAMVKAGFLGPNEGLPIVPGSPDPAPFGWPPNAAIGCTVINQEEAARDIPHLLAAKAALKPAFAFLSMEPLLGPVDLRRLDTMAYRGAEELDALTGDLMDFLHCKVGKVGGIDWVITGGETDQRLEDGSIHQARPADPAWYRSLRDQCAAAGVPFHFKQWGEWQPFMGQVPTNHNPKGVHHFDQSLGAAPVFRLGKDVDPCTLDGVRHDARPTVRGSAKVAS